MKAYLILKDFDGSQDGINGESFVAGTTRLLADSLVQALGGVNGGFVREAATAAREIAKAAPALAEPVLDTIAGIEPRELAEDEMLEEGVLPEGTRLDPHARETKVTGPAETKPMKPLTKMSKAELVAHALSLGLELVPDSMTIKEMIAAIEAHTPAA